MARVQLILDDPGDRLTLKALLEAEGHVVVERDPEVVIASDVEIAAAYAHDHPTLILATASQVRDAVAAMRRGVFGYIFVPFQPGEAGVMVQRALGSQPASAEDPSPETLEEVETRHILAALRHCKNKQAPTARLLGIGRNTLWRKLKRIRDREKDAAREETGTDE